MLGKDKEVESLRSGWFVGCSILLLIVLFVTSPVSLLAQDRIPEGPLKERFFQELTRPQIISLLETLDRSEQRTDFELGAKYRWGYIPPDRRPPVHLARWWGSLSQRERNNQRFQWFQQHYDQLNVDRAARELGQTDRLLKIQRDLQQNYGKTPEELESVFFPGDTVTPPRSTEQEDRQFAGTYRQTIDEPDQPGEMVPTSDSDRTSPDETSGEKTSSSRSTSTGASDTRTQASPTTDQESSEARSGVRFRRVGDEIQVIEESTGSQRSSTRPDTADFEVDEKTSDDDSETSSDRPSRSLDGSPNLNLNNSGRQSTSWLPPQPNLRSGIPRPDLRVPNR
jgi:hypothetical protein